MHKKIFYNTLGSSPLRAMARSVKALGGMEPEDWGRCHVFLPSPGLIPLFYEACHEEGLVCPPRALCLDTPLGYDFSLHTASVCHPRLDGPGLTLCMLEFLDMQGLCHGTLSPQAKLALAKGFHKLCQDMAHQKHGRHPLMEPWEAFLASKGYAMGVASTEQQGWWQQHKPPGWVMVLERWRPQGETLSFLQGVLTLPQSYILLPPLPQFLQEDFQNQLTMPPSHPLTLAKDMLEALGASLEDMAPFPWCPPEQSPLVTKRVEIFLASCGQVLDMSSRCHGEHEDMSHAVEGCYTLTLEEEGQEPWAVCQMVAQALQEGFSSMLVVTPLPKLAYDVHRALQAAGITMAPWRQHTYLESQEATLMMLCVAFFQDPSVQKFWHLVGHPLVAALLPSGLWADIEGLLRGYHWPQDVVAFLEDKAPLTRHPFLVKLFARTCQDMLSSTTLGNGEGRSLGVWIGHHMAFLEALRPDIWQEAASLLTFMTTLYEGWTCGHAISLEEYGQWLQAFLVQTPPYASWTETSLQAPVMLCQPWQVPFMEAQLCIMAGVVEGAWPSTTSSSMAWGGEHGAMAMQAWNTALGGADFAACLSFPKTIIVASPGETRMPSRFLVRWESALASLGLKLPLLPLVLQRYVPPEVPEDFWADPQVSPQDSPGKISVTSVDMARKNPYAFYARHMLRVRPPEAFAPWVDKRFLGVVMHQICERIMTLHPPQEAVTLEQLERSMETLVQGITQGMPLTFFQRAGLQAMSQSFVTTEWHRRQHQGGYRAFLEVYGEHSFALDGGVPITLTARGDRLDVWPQGQGDMIDYKTGTLPTAKDLQEGRCLQLPLELFLLREGKFPQVHGHLPWQEEAVKATWWHFSFFAPIALVPYAKSHDEEILQAGLAWVYAFLTQPVVYQDTGCHEELFLLSRLPEKAQKHALR